MTKARTLPGLCYLYDQHMIQICLLSQCLVLKHYRFYAAGITLQ